MTDAHASLFPSLEELRNDLPRATTRNREREESDRSFPIDLLNGVDLAMIHELSHAIGGSHKTKDVEGRHSYKWGNVRRLGPTTGFQNADSFAYFVLIASLISPPNTEDTPMRVDGAGNVMVLPV